MRSQGGCWNGIYYYVNWRDLDWVHVTALHMKRAAYVSSWVALALYGVLAVGAFIAGLPFLRYVLVAVVVVGITLVAFHAKQSRLLPVVAAVLNGVLALLVFTMVANGINFAVGSGAFLTAAVFLAVFFVPALLNTIAMASLFRTVTRGSRSSAEQ